MKILSDWLAGKLYKYLPNGSKNKETLAYGIHMLIYIVVTTICLVAIGCLFKQLIESLILTAIFYTNQTVGGGFHANSHSKCFAITATGASFCLLANKMIDNLAISVMVSLTSATVLLIIPVVLHPNRYYLNRFAPKYIIRSRIVTTIETVIYILACLLNSKFTHIIAYGLLASAISRINGKAFNSI